jgi:preprotein translocase subunit Sss1
VPITIYLLIFYISASYSAFFKEFESDTLIAAIFDPQALTKAYAESWLEVLLITTIPFVFLGFGYIIHMIQKSNDRRSEMKVVFLYVITFLFDGLLAYEIEYNIYKFNQTLMSPEFDLSIAITKPGFWLIIFAGFVVYIIWGMVFDVIMNEYESLDKINVFINSKKKEKQDLKKKKEESISEVSSFKDSIATLNESIDEAQSKIDGFIFPSKTYLVHHNNYIKGWLQAISTELALPNNEKDELLNRCTVVGEEHLKKLSINEGSSQNIIYE